MKAHRGKVSKKAPSLLYRLPYRYQLVIAAGDAAHIALLIYQLQPQDSYFSGLLSSNRSWIKTSLQPRLQLTNAPPPPHSGVIVATF